MPVWLTTVVVKAAVVETCTPYDVAPGAVFHVSVSAVGRPPRPFVGDESVGGNGLAVAVRLEITS
jgi:hypothetical protein